MRSNEEGSFRCHRAASRRMARWGWRRRWGLGALALSAPFAQVPLDAAHAQTLPQGGNIVSGSGNIQQTSSTQLTINQSSQNLSIDWQSFSVGAGHIVRFNQPNSSALALNRVLGSDPSQIFGSIQANGRVVIMNPNGIYFGPNSRVDVNGMVATTARQSQADFLAGTLNFSVGSSDPNARVVNEGAINVALGGFAVLAAAVENRGTVIAQGGTVVLAGTPTFTVDFHGDGLLKFAATGMVTQAPNGATALVENSGTIQANGGRVIMTARSARDVINNVINTTGIVEARSARVENGEIVIDGGSNGIVSVNGLVDASGNAPDARGGNVTILGERVGLFENARVNVSGAAGGGQALVGGNYQGQGPEPNAKMVYMDARAVIDASSSAGDGGRVILWSDEATRNAGHINVSGARDGGFIEVSSKGFLDFRGTVDLRGLAGRAGNLLLDPTDITITSGASSGDMSGTSPFAGSNATSNLDVSVLNAALTGGTVTVTTASAGAGTGNIDITAGIVNGSAGTTLILRADGAITIGTGGSIGSGGYLFNVSLRAAGNITVGGSGISTSGGTITTESAGGGGQAGGNFVSTANINAGSGNVTLAHTGTISIGGTLNTSGQVSIDAGGATTQSAAITGSGSLAVGGTGAVTLNHVSNAFGTITLARTGIATSVSLTTTVTPSLSASNIGTGSFSLFGVGFTQSGAITQGAGGGNVTISGGAGTVTLSQANQWTGAVTVTSQTIDVTTTQTATGSGSFSFDATRGVAITSNIFAAGNISIWGNAPGGVPSNTPSAGTTIGVDIKNPVGAGVTISSTAGSISISGSGGSSGNYNANHGVVVDGASLVANAGGITIKGRGGANAAGERQVGVFINGDTTLFGNPNSIGTTLSAGAGGLNIEGAGGVTGSIGSNVGLWIARAELGSSGAITLIGDGGAGPNSHSIEIAGANILSTGAGLLDIRGRSILGTGTGVRLRDSYDGGATSVLIGGASFAGNLNIETDSISNTASSLTISRGAGSGLVWFLPNTSATPVTFNGTGSGLELTSSILSALTGFAEIKAGYKFGMGALSVAAPYTAVSNTNLILNAGGTLTVANALTASGTGSITLESARNVEISANVTTAIGDIRVLANTDLFSWQSPPYTSASVTFGSKTGSFVGVNIAGGAGLTATGGGAIAVAGKGGTVAGNGVFLGDGSVITANGGAVSIVGAGGAPGAHGVEFYQVSAGVNSIIAGGAVTIVGGDGTGGDANWFGVVMNGAGISGASSISITGRGGANGSGIGLYIINGAGITSTGAGSITLTGETANAGSSGFLLSGGSVSAPGTGSISIVSSKNVSIGGNVTTASGDILITGNVASWAPSYATNAPVFGTTSGNFFGVDITANVTSSGGGNVAIAGKGGDTGSYNHGIVTSGSPTISAAGAGNVTIYGLGGPSTTHISGNGAHIGVNFVGGSISTVDGTLKVVGTGGGAGATDNNVGIQVFNTFVGSNDNGNVNVIATGGNGGSRGYVGAGTFGVYASASGSGTGTLTLTGTGGTGYYLSGDGYNWHSTGVEVSGGSVIEARGSGLLSVTGTGGGAGTGTNVVGVSVLSGGLIKAQGSGGATIIGTGGNGNGAGNHGVVINNSNVESTGSGDILMTGTAGTGTSPVGISFAGTSVTVGGGTHAGNTTLRGNSISSNATTLNLSRQAIGGTITFRPDTDSTSIGVNGGAGTLVVSGVMLGAVSGFAGIEFGSASQTGAIQIDSTGFARNLTIQTQGSALTNSLTMGTSNLTVIAHGGYTQGVGPITSSGTVTFSGPGDVTATDAGNSFGSLVLAKTGSAANVNISTNAGAMSLGTSTMGTGTLTLAGAGFSQTGGFTQDAAGGTVTLSGGTNAVTLSQANTFTGDLTVTGGSVTVSGPQSLARAGLQTVGLTSTVGGVLVQGNIVKTSSGGANINVTGSETVRVLNAAVNSGGGSITLWGNAPGGDNTTGANVGTAWGIEINGATAELNSGAGNISIVGKGATDTSGQHGIVFWAGATIQSTTGSITLVGRGGAGTGSDARGIIIDNGSIQTQSGAISLTGWGGAISANGHGIELASATIAASAGANLTLNGTGNNGGLGLNIMAASSLNAGSGSLSLTSNNGLNIGSTVLTAGGPTTLSGDAGAITATNASNQLTGTVILTNSAGNVSLTNAGATALGTSSVTGNLTLISGGNLTQVNPLTVGGTSSFTANGGSIAMTNAENSFAGAITLANGGNNAISVLGTGGLTVGNVTGGGGGITLTAFGSSFTQQAGTSIVQSGGTGKVQLDSGGGTFTLRQITALGGLDVNSGGAIAQTAGTSLNVGGAANFIAGDGAITLTQPNVFSGPVGLQSGTGNASVSASGNLSFAASSVGTLNVTVGSGTVSQVGAISTTGAASFVAANGLTLTNAGNAFGGPLSINVPVGSAALTNSGGIQFASVDVENSLTVTAGGALTQTGPILVGTGTTSLSGGTMTLNDTNNNFGSSLTLAGTGGTLSGTVNALVGAAAATASPQVITALNPGFVFASTAIGAPPPPVTTVTVIDSTTISQIAQVLAAILTSTTTNASSSNTIDSANAAPASPAAVQAALVAILREAAAAQAGQGGTQAASEGGPVLVTPAGGTPPAAGAPAAPAPAGTFAVGTTITINTVNGQSAITVTPPAGGGPPRVILPGLLNLNPPTVPSATAFGVPGLSGNFMLNGAF